MKTKILYRAAIPLAFFSMYCSGRGDVDLSKATPLTAEPVASGPAAGVDPNGPIQLNSLFTLPPGTWTAFQVLGGAIDPVGTTLQQDFDGDGINNGAETTSNFWVADYPVIESQIAPPVTMRIEVLKTDKSDSTTINTDLTSDNFESRKNEGSEKFHQDEINLKTINNGSTTDSSSTSSSSTSSQEIKASASVGFFGIGASVSGGSSSSSTNSSSSSNSTVRQTFEDRPFVNNVDRTALSTKSDAAAKKARDYRAEKRKKRDEEYTTKPDGGIIRAALYIKNQSVNMPVKLTNILCSLVFETTGGALIPIQSFRLRNDDFSLFEVEIYGNSEFGPYVVELKNLNTVEVENAIALGYTPKVFIVDYKMTHVQDSNYRMSLSSNFTGDNLKIIEENAKGRTASLKLMHPNYRNLFRIVAFDTKMAIVGGVPATDICKASNIDATAVSPGVSMYKYLERLKCSGIDIQFGHFIYDFRGMPGAGTYPRVYNFMVKSVDGRGVAAPCSSTVSGTGFNPITGNYETVSDVCVISIKDLTEDQLDNLKVWATFNNGKYYKPGDFARDISGNMISFDGVSVSSCDQPGQPCGIAVLKGMSSMVWAGDNYDLVYLRMSDYIARTQKFGTNPLETGITLSYNTKWDLNTVGEYPFDPETRSIYLGEAGLGDQIELKFNLKNTTFLNPDFGTNFDTSTNLEFRNFTYNPQKSTKKFNIEEAIDFELSLGLGGGRADWQNIMRPAAGINAITLGPVTVDYLSQKFTVVVNLPQSHPLAAGDGVVKLYLRPALSNAYRNVIWPQHYSLVKKYDTTIFEDPTGGILLKIKSGIGSINDISAGNVLKIVSGGTVYSYTIANSGISVPTAYGYDITTTTNLSTLHKAGDRVYIDATLGGPQVAMRIDRFSDTDNFFAAYTGQYASRPLMTDNASIDCNLNFAPTRCYGYSSTSLFDFVTNNWGGGVGFDNSWSDGSSWSKGIFLQKGIGPLVSGKSATQLGGMGLSLLSPNLTAILANDIPVSTTNYSNQSNVKLVVSGNRAFVVWQSTGSDAGNIYGRIIDFSTGLGVGNDFIINSTTANTQWLPQVALSGNRAMVVWQSNDTPANLNDIRGRFVDIAEAKVIGSDFLISNTVADEQLKPQVAAGGSKAIVVWQSNDTPSQLNNIRGRVYDLASATPASTDFLISTDPAPPASPMVQIDSQVAASGDRALVVWRESNTNEIRGRVLNLAANGNPVGPDFPAALANANQQINPQISLSGDRGIIVWQTRNGSLFDVKGRFVDLSAGIALGGLNVSTSANGESPQVALNGYRAIAVWQSQRGADSWEIYGRVMDLSTNPPIGNDFLINAPNTGSQVLPQVSVSGDRALVTWQSDDTPGNNFDIRGKFLDLSNNGAGIGGEFLISTTSVNYQIGPQLAMNGNRAMVAWQSHDNGADDDIRGRAFNLTPNFGLNNFFTAPLIERNYTVTSRIKF